MEHAAPCGDGLVGGKEHCALPAVAFVDDMEEHVRRICPVGEVSHFIDDEQIGMRVGGQRVGQPPRAKAVREVVDEFRGGDEARGKAILDGAVSDGDRQMRLSASRFAEQDQRAPLGDEVRGEGRAKEREPHGGLVREIEIVDRLEEGKRGGVARFLRSRGR